MDINCHIIIVTYNGMQWIERCLKSCGLYPIIVIDNSSTDNTVQFIETNFPDVTILKQNENLGFGGANNLGIKLALTNGASHVFLLNQDAYLFSDTIDNLLKLKKDKNYGILSPIHLDNTEQRLDYNFSKYISFKSNPYLIKDALSNTLKQCYEVPFVNAAGWLLSKECIDKVGYFDPLFFMYGEDDNYCQRVRYHNLKIGVSPAAFMIHDRQDRKEENIAAFSEKYYAKKRTFYIINLGDVNNDNYELKLKDYVRAIQKKIKFSRRRFKFNKASQYKKELVMLKKLMPNIIKRRALNKNFKN